MKIFKLLLLPFFCMLFSGAAVTAQSGKIPPFRMVQSNGKIFKAENLPMGKPVIIVYFSPDCDHCDKLAQNIAKRSNDFKKASIAMITYLPVKDVTRFVAKHNLNKHSNIYVGTEGNTFFTRDYYHVSHMPFMALYTRNGDLVKFYDNENYLNEMYKALRALN